MFRGLLKGFTHRESKRIWTDVGFFPGLGKHTFISELLSKVLFECINPMKCFVLLFI